MHNFVFRCEPTFKETMPAALYVRMITALKVDLYGAENHKMSADRLVVRPHAKHLHTCTKRGKSVTCP